MERRQAPILPVGVERVGRGSDRHFRGQQVLPLPGVGAARIESDRQVLHDADRLRGRSQLTIDQPLLPGVEVDRRGVFLGELGHGRIS